MKKIRLIARLDIKNNTVVKGIHLEGLRVVGKPNDLAHKYYRDRADELLYMDAVAALYERNSLNEIIKKAAKKIFIPMTVGGGIRKLEDISQILKSGADKVAINTAAVKNPLFLKDTVKKFGSQCVVLSIEAKKIGEKKWEAYVENGRERSHKDVVKWIKQALDLGVGEILLTSIDRDGTKTGFDIELIREVAPLCKVPLIVSGGAGKVKDIISLSQAAKIDAIAVASALHYKMFTINEAKKSIKENMASVRL